MKGAIRQLTAKQEQFARLVAEEGHSLVGAYRIAYPPRNGERSATAEYVAARRAAHRPLVEHRIEELRAEVFASDPAEMRRRALAVLSRIMVKEVDPRYRRTALDVLRYLDEQDRAAEAEGWAEYRAAAAQIAALNEIEARRKNPAHSTPEQPVQQTVPQESATGAGSTIDRCNLSTVESAEDTERRHAEILKVVKDRQRKHRREVVDSETVFRPDFPREDPRHTARGDAVEEDPAQYARRPGRFGKGGWVRLPNSH